VAVDVTELPIAVLLLPGELETFILRDQARDLLRAPGVVAVEPPRARYGLVSRLPSLTNDVVAGTQARRLKLPGTPKVIVMFHPVQLPLARALLARYPGSELWYSRWDRYEHAYDASPRVRDRLQELHDEAAANAALIFTVSEALARLERESGRGAMVLTSAADSFPAPDPSGTVVALSLGHLGHRVDWTLLRGVSDRLGDQLVCLLVGDVHPEELRDDPDFAACRERPNLVFLGRLEDEQAARLVLCADVGIVPFKVEPFNAAGLPNRILKAARLGRRTITPMLEGVLTWDHAITRADGPDEWAEALRANAGARTRPDLELRDWALAHTAELVDLPLWQRLDQLGIDTGPARLVG
jgi:glycosyltransferase involved in cell wall biosynthesis